MEENTITLKQWLDTMPDMEQKRELFLYGDMALNYLNDKGVIVDSFDPMDIDLINGDIKKIRFNVLSSNDDYASLKENLYNYCKFGIRLYLDYYDYLDDKFLKSNFSEFEFGLPQDDINYFKGVIQRGSFVYFNEFDFELKKKKLKELDSYAAKEEAGDAVDISSLTKPNNNVSNSEIYGNNPKESLGLYDGGRVRTKDAAFVEFMYYPVILSIVLGILLLIAYCFFGI